jgi:BMFP domain-containing protein YqiC
MSQGPNRIFDDLGRLMTDAASVAQGMQREVQTVVKMQMERFLSDMDLVTREDFETVKAMAEKAREDNEALKARLDQLERQLTSEGGSNA